MDINFEGINNKTAKKDQKKYNINHIRYRRKLAYQKNLASR